MTELMSLEEINGWQETFENLYEPEDHPSGQLLCETARAAHRLQEVIEHLHEQLKLTEQFILNANFAELMKVNVLAELEKARAEERERCAKAASEAAWKHLGHDWDSKAMDYSARQQVDACVKAIRALKD